MRKEYIYIYMWVHKNKIKWTPWFSKMH
jgi:hypothetical protein